MYAIIETGGKQYKVSEGSRIDVEDLGLEVGSEVKIDKVLALIKDDGGVFGSPYVAGTEVRAEVLEKGLGKKVLVFKQKPRKNHRKLIGHRQSYTKLLIKEIKSGG